MSKYIIGDIQGKFKGFIELLEKIQFNPNKDKLYLLGDTINRGFGDVETLRYIMDHQNSINMVLGNHEIHLLAAYYSAREIKNRDTFTDILNAPDCDKMVHFLSNQRLIIKKKKDVFVHAGIPPIWDIKTAVKMAGMVEKELKRSDPSLFLNAVYNLKRGGLGRWRNSSNQAQKLTYIMDVLTQMRLCDEHSVLNFSTKDPEYNEDGMRPWFEHQNKGIEGYNIYFGHWSNLGITQPKQGIYAMDTGCVYEKSLSAINKDTKEIISVSCNAN